MKSRFLLNLSAALPNLAVSYFFEPHGPAIYKALWILQLLLGLFMAANSFFGWRDSRI